MRVQFRAGLFLLALVAGCSSSSSGPSDPNELNLLLNNQTGRRIIVELTIGGTQQSGISINNGAFVSDEFTGGAAGQAIKIEVKDAANLTVKAERFCTPKSTIFGTTVYGQIDFGGFTPSGILCQDPNTWQ